MFSFRRFKFPCNDSRCLLVAELGIVTSYVTQLRGSRRSVSALIVEQLAVRVVVALLVRL